MVCAGTLVMPHAAMEYQYPVQYVKNRLLCHSLSCPIGLRWQPEFYSRHLPRRKPTLGCAGSQDVKG